jgi:hypothetical protein
MHGKKIVSFLVLNACNMSDVLLKACDKLNLFFSGKLFFNLKYKASSDLNNNNSGF